MPNCAVIDCTNHNKKTQGTDIQYFRFPKQADLSNQWTLACWRMDEINIKNACICSEHFEKSCFEVPLKQRLLNYNPKNSRHLKPNAIPTVNVGNPELRDNGFLKRKSDDKWSEGFTKRRNRQVSEPLILPKVELIEENADISVSITVKSEVQPVQDMDNCTTKTICMECIGLRGQIAALQAENTELHQKIENLKKKSFPKAILSNIFSPGQIKKLINPNHTIHWSAEDIAAAISLCNVSPKAYRYLRNFGYPLPALSTLRCWTSTFSLQQNNIDLSEC